MATKFKEVYEYALTEINSYVGSDSLRELLRTNKALFYRKMFLYLQMGVPMFDRPVGIDKKLQYIKPKWEDKYFNLEAKTELIDSGMKGYDTAVASTMDYVLKGEYDSESGIITLENPTSEYCVVSVDCYTDGEFLHDLSNKEKAICGKCIAYQWFVHFSMDELNMLPKMKDSSFNVGSEFGDKNANTARMNALLEVLLEEMSSYANDFSKFGNRGWKPPWQ